MMRDFHFLTERSARRFMAALNREGYDADEVLFLAREHHCIMYGIKPISCELYWSVFVYSVVCPNNHTQVGLWGPGFGGREIDSIRVSIK